MISRMEDGETEKESEKEKEMYRRRMRVDFFVHTACPPPAPLGAVPCASYLMNAEVIFQKLLYLTSRLVLTAQQGENQKQFVQKL